MRTPQRASLWRNLPISPRALNWPAASPSTTQRSSPVLHPPSSSQAGGSWTRYSSTRRSSLHWSSPGHRTSWGPTCSQWTRQLPWWHNGLSSVWFSQQMQDIACWTSWICSKSMKRFPWSWCSTKALWEMPKSALTASLDIQSMWANQIWSKWSAGQSSCRSGLVGTSHTSFLCSQLHKLQAGSQHLQPDKRQDLGKPKFRWSPSSSCSCPASLQFYSRQSILHSADITCSSRPYQEQR